jgi:hypothetical protein
MGLLVGCETSKTVSGPSTETSPKLSVEVKDSIAPLYGMDDPKRIPGRYIVRFHGTESNPEEATREIVGRHGGRVYKELRSLKGVLGGAT